MLLATGAMARAQTSDFAPSFTASDAATAGVAASALADFAGETVSSSPPVDATLASGLQWNRAGQHDPSWAKFRVGHGRSFVRGRGHFAAARGRRQRRPATFAAHGGCARRFDVAGRRIETDRSQKTARRQRFQIVPVGPRDGGFYRPPRCKRALIPNRRFSGMLEPAPSPPRASRYAATIPLMWSPEPPWVLRPRVSNWRRIAA